jgi:hypothetical protein
LPELLLELPDDRPDEDRVPELLRLLPDERTDLLLPLRLELDRVALLRVGVLRLGVETLPLPLGRLLRTCRLLPEERTVFEFDERVDGRVTVVDRLRVVRLSGEYVRRVPEACASRSYRRRSVPSLEPSDEFERSER